MRTEGKCPAVIALTKEQTTGFRYHSSFLQAFEAKARGYNYSLVTLIHDSYSQTYLHDTFDARSPCETGQEYNLFDLQHPNQPHKDG